MWGSSSCPSPTKLESCHCLQTTTPPVGLKVSMSMAHKSLGYYMFTQLLPQVDHNTAGVPYIMKIAVSDLRTIFWRAGHPFFLSKCQVHCGGPLRAKRSASLSVILLNDAQRSQNGHEPSGTEFRKSDFLESFLFY